MKRGSGSLPCPCGSGKGYAACCGTLHAGGVAESAEALMRSRYSAYVLGLTDYLLHTWHTSTRPAELDLTGGPKWLGLTVLRHEATSEETAIVEFVARYKVGGRAGKLAELSRFVRENGRWYYVDGDVG